MSSPSPAPACTFANENHVVDESSDGELSRGYFHIKAENGAIWAESDDFVASSKPDLSISESMSSTTLSNFSRTVFSFSLSSRSSSLLS